MVKIKICGITNTEDALDAAALGASALGFILSTSQRQVSPETVKKITSQLPPFITTVGVFVNEEADYVKEVAETCKLDIIQLHGYESPEYCLQMPRRVIKAFRILGTHDLEIIEKYKKVACAILLDTYVVNTPGGTGKTFDWGLAIEAKKHGLPIIVAGGVNPENVTQAIKTANPYAIDLSSGVESTPGKKDYNKLSSLFQKLSLE